MKIDLIKMNETCDRLPEVTSSTLFVSRNNEIDPEGLVSYEIFGKPGTPSRSKNLAHIKLNNFFINPHVLTVMVGVQRTIRSCVYGDGEFYIYNGYVLRVKKSQPIPKNAPVGTGIKFLMENYEKIDFKPKKTDAQATYEKKKFLHSLTKEEVFIDKWIVIPAFYRDVDVGSSNVKKKNVINTMYQRIINNASLIKNASAVFDIFGSTGSHKVIQDTLTELYMYFISVICGVHGLIHKHVMGKSVDYSARCVISGPRYDTNVPEEAEVSFTHSALPLSVAIKIFAPFIVPGVKNVVKEFLKGRNYLYWKNPKTKKVERVQLADDWESDISSDRIHSLIDLFYKSVDHRVDRFYLRGSRGEKIPLIYLTNDAIVPAPGDEEDILIDDMARNRPVSHAITLTELFYMVAYNTISDNVIYVSRYPIEDYNSIYPSMFNIIPCENVAKKVINGIEYPRFPIVDKIIHSPNIRRHFIDTLRLYPSYLSALDADFDGDQVSVYSVFTDKAIEDAKKQIYSLSNIINIKGDNTTRELPEVCRATLYGLTYSDPNILK